MGDATVGTREEHVIIVVQYHTRPLKWKGEAAVIEYILGIGSNLHDVNRWRVTYKNYMGDSSSNGSGTPHSDSEKRLRVTKLRCSEALL